jgi:nitrite reductase (NADH) small subunit
MTWIEIGKLNDIPRLGARVIKTSVGDVALYRTSDDNIFALRDRCPHKGGPLSQGIVFDQRVACPLHDWVIDLQSGCAEGPDEGCTHVYAVKIEAGRISISLRANTDADKTQANPQLTDT